MKKSQKSLRDWTNQKWRTSDGSPSKGKKRYLPDAAWKALSPGEKAATNRAKAKGDKKGKQFVKQPENIAKKTAKYRAMGGLISSKFQNGGGLPKYETTLSLEEEANFMPWLESQYKAGNITKGDFDFYKKNNYGYDYDFRAAYKEGLKSSLNSKDNMQHWGDIGKKPNHPTFSNESKYHNVDGNIGGIWDGENFIRPYVAPYDLLEVEITPEGAELKDQPKELEIYYRDYAAQYPREAYIQYRKENPIGREKIKAINSKEWNDYIEKQANKEYKDRIRNYAAEQLLKTNPQGDRNRKEYLKSFTEQELAVLKNSKSKGKVNPTLLQKFEGALKKGAAGGPFGGGDKPMVDKFLHLLNPSIPENLETESLTAEEMKDIGVLDLLGPISIPAKLVQAGYKDGYSFLDALKGQENDASLIEEIATDPLNLVGIGLVSKGASAAKLLKAYKNLSKLSNAKRASTLQNAALGKYNRVVGGEDAIEDLIQSNLVRVNDKAGVTNDLGPFGIVNRTTPYPSFGAGPPQQTYIDRVISQGKTPYVISTDRPMKVSTLGRHGKGSTMFPINQEGKYISGFPASEAQVYKITPQGYEKIEIPTLNERLKNNPSYVINPEVRSTKKLAKESEPYLKSSTPPRSRQDEIVEGFAPGLRQERIEKTTVNFNPDSSEIGKNFKSEIDWAKWNPDTPKNKALMEEYAAIEKAGIPSADEFPGSTSFLFEAKTGMPTEMQRKAQYVHSQSKAFKKAFPEGYEQAWHGSKFDDLKNVDISKNVRSVHGKGLYMTDNFNEAMDLANIRSKGAVDPNTGRIIDPTIYNLGIRKGDIADLVKARKKGIAQYEIEPAIKKYTDPNLPANAEEAAKRYAKQYNKKVEDLHDWEKTTAVDAYGTKETIPEWLKTSEGDLASIMKWKSHYNTWYKAQTPKIKSLLGNVGTYDMTNPNIYKSLAPIVGAGAAGTALSQEKAMGGNIDTDPPQEPSLLTSLKQGYLNPYNWGVEDYTDKYKTWDEAYAAAKKAGLTEIMWNKGPNPGRKNLEYAGTPRQEVGAYGIKGKPVHPMDLDYPAQVNVHNPSIKYIPGHIEAQLTDYLVDRPSVNYSLIGNYPFGINTKQDKNKKTYNVYGDIDKEKFEEKAFSLPTGEFSLLLGLDETPSDWNLFTNNCADNVCDAFGIPRSKGIQTPSGAMSKIKEKYPTIDVTGRTYPDYENISENLKTKSSDDVLKNSKHLLGLSYAPDLQNSLVPKNIITSIQKALVEKGYKLPKSTKKDGTFDGVLGNETINALLDYQTKNKKAMGGTLDKSVMGYRDDSPYKNEPYIDINTPTGEIDMSKTGVSLYANGKLLKPYSGKHKFNTSKVREVPVSNSWLDKYK